jgi:hypothetical protein
MVAKPFHDRAAAAPEAKTANVSNATAITTSWSAISISDHRLTALIHMDVNRRERIESHHAVTAEEPQPGLHRPEVNERPLSQRAMYVFR